MVFDIAPEGDNCAVSRQARQPGRGWRYCPIGKMLENAARTDLSSARLAGSFLTLEDVLPEAMISFVLINFLFP